MTNKIEGGATIWARRTIDSRIFYDKPDKWFKIWFYVVNKVNHAPYRKWDRGQGFMTYSEITDKTKASKNQIDSFLRFAKEQSMLTTQKQTRGMVVTVLSYERFQDLKNYRTDTGTETEPKQNRNRTETINKNEKNVKNEKKRVSFETFWEAYPKKRNKGGAEKAFKKIVAADYLMLIPKIEELKNTADWMKDGGAFIPYPATWLNAKGWMDEVDIDMPKDDAFYINALNDVGQHKFIAKYGEELFIKYAVHYVPKQ